MKRPSESAIVVALVSGSEYINHMYLVLLPPILVLLARDFSVGLSLLGVAMGIQRLATTVFQLPFGWLSDNHSRTLGLGLSLGLGTLGAFMVAAAPSFPVLLVAVSFVGIGIAGHHPSHYPLLSEAVEEHQRGRAFSIRGFTGSLGFATPPTVVTIVLALGGTTWRHAIALMAVIGALYTVITIAAFSRWVGDDVKIPADRNEAGPERSGSIRARVGAELRDLVSSPPILALAVLAFVIAFANNGITAYAVVHLTDGYGLGLDLANLTLTAMFVTGAFMTLVGGDLADRFSAGAVLVLTFVLFAALVAAFATLALPALLVLPVAIAIGGVRMLSGPARSKLVDKFSSRGSLGQSFAVMTVGMMAGAAASPPTFGVLIETVGLRLAFFGMALAGIAALVVSIAIVASYDEFSLAPSRSRAD